MRRNPEAPDFQTKTALRETALDVLVLAKQVVELDEGALVKLDLPSAIFDLVKHCQRITQNIAHKREVQFLAKQLRKLDDTALDQLGAQLGERESFRRQQAAEHHALERWRTRLLDRDDATVWSELLQRYPRADRRQLQAQVDRVHKVSLANESNRKAQAHKLFVQLREIHDLQDSDHE
jgi:ribosome-associated protein